MSRFLNSTGTRVGRLLAAAVVLTAILCGHLYAQRSAADPVGDLGDVGTAKAEALILDANLGGRLEAALGDSFGGVWFDQATGRLHVGVTSPASRQRAEATAARAGLSELVAETPVESTWAQVTTAQQVLDRHLDDLFAEGKVRTSSMPDTNSVIVELASAVPASRLAALQRQASRTGVEVSVTIADAPQLLGTPEKRCKKFETEEAYCDKPIAAGMRIDANNETSCTAGPAVLLQDLSTEQKSTATYILTAGHCIKEAGGVGSEWFAFTKEEEKILIGSAVAGLKGEKGVEDKVDIGVIEVEKPNWVHETDTPVTPGVVEWSEAEDVDPTPVTAPAAAPIKGTKVCISGQISGKKCGEVFATSVSKTFVKREGEKIITEWTVEKLVEVEGATTGGGTSGGPWYLEAKPGEVLGTHVGAGTVKEGGMEFQRKWYQPLAISFANLATKYQLLTTTNQKRKHPAAGPPFTASAYPAFATGSSTRGSEAFSTEAGKVECDNHYEGMLPGITTTLALKPTYTNCQAFGFLSATINAEECTYELHSTEEVSSSNFKSHFDVVCPTGQSIKITAATCKAEIKAQTGLTTVKTTNESEKVKVTWELTGIAYTVTQDGFGCPFLGTGNKTAGQYSGELVLSRAGGGSIDVGT